METERLILRNLVSQDLENIYEWTSDEEVTQYLTWPTHQNKETTKRILDQWLEEYKQENCYRLGIVLKENNKLIGMIDVVDYKEDQPVVGYVLNQNYWGHGYMTEAFSGVIDYLKEQGFHKIYIEADQRNIGSNCVIQKNGFTFTHQETKSCSSFKPDLVTVNWYERVLD